MGARVTVAVTGATPGTRPEARALDPASNWTPGPEVPGAHWNPQLKLQGGLKPEGRSGGLKERVRRAWGLAEEAAAPQSHQEGGGVGRRCQQQDEGPGPPPDPQRQARPCPRGLEPLSTPQGRCLLSSHNLLPDSALPEWPRRTSGPRVPNPNPQMPPKLGVTTWRHRKYLAHSPPPIAQRGG